MFKGKSVSKCRSYHRDLNPIDLEYEVNTPQRRSNPFIQVFNTSSAVTSRVGMSNYQWINDPQLPRYSKTLFIKSANFPLRLLRRCQVLPTPNFTLIVLVISTLKRHFSLAPLPLPWQFLGVNYFLELLIAEINLRCQTEQPRTK